MGKLLRNLIEIIHLTRTVPRRYKSIGRRTRAQPKLASETESEQG